MFRSLVWRMSHHARDGQHAADLDVAFGWTLNAHAGNCKGVMSVSQSVSQHVGWFVWQETCGVMVFLVRHGGSVVKGKGKCVRKE